MHDEFSAPGNLPILQTIAINLNLSIYGEIYHKKSNSICHYVEKYVNTHIPLNLCMIYGEVYEKKSIYLGK